jgi:hypothetical protein
MNRYATNYGAGKVHLARPASRSVRFSHPVRPWYTVLYCTGRAVSGALATSEVVTCKACLKRAKREGVEP